VTFVRQSIGAADSVDDAAESDTPAIKRIIKIGYLTAASIGWRSGRWRG